MNEGQSGKVLNKTFVCCMMCQACHGMAAFMANPLISSYAAYMGAGAKLVGLLTGLYLGVSVLMRPFAGPAVVRMDKKKLLVVTYTIGAVVNFCYGAFSNMTVFVLARAFHGLQYSLMGTLLITIAGDSLPKDKMGSGLGLFGISTAISGAVGPSLGLALRSWGTSAFGTLGGYKVMFFAASALVCCALVPCSMIKVKKRSREELMGTGPWYKNIIALPALPAAVCNMFFAMAFALYSAYMVPYAEEKGFAGVTLYFTFYAFIMLVSRPLAGRLTDRYGPAAVIYPSSAFFIISFLMLWGARNVYTVYATAFFSALGYGAAYPALQTNSLKSVPPIKRGVASNTSYFGIDLGGFLGPTYGGFIISAFLKTGKAYSTMYLFGIVPVLLAVLTYTLTRKYMSRVMVMAAAAES